MARKVRHGLARSRSPTYWRVFAFAMCFAFWTCFPSPKTANRKRYDAYHKSRLFCYSRAYSLPSIPRSYFALLLDIPPILRLCVALTRIIHNSHRWGDSRLDKADPISLAGPESPRRSPDPRPSTQKSLQDLLPGPPSCQQDIALPQQMPAESPPPAAHQARPRYGSGKAPKSLKLRRSTP